MSFYIMWNHTTLASRTLSRSKVDNMGSPITLYFEDNNLIMELPEYENDIYHIWYQTYIPSATYNPVDPAGSFDMILKRQSEDKSTKEWSLVQLDGMSTLDQLVLGSMTPNTRKEEIIEFQYKITSKENILSSGSMALTYNPIPTEYALDKAYPNPFNPVTTLRFALPIETDVSIAIYDLQGREIVSLIQNKLDAGYHTAVWNADAEASGLYFVKMIAGDYLFNQKLMLVK